MSEGELEYVTQFMDYYQAGASHDGRTDMGDIIGHIEEFAKQQESGKTEWQLPKSKIVYNKS